MNSSEARQGKNYKVDRLVLKAMVIAEGARIRFLMRAHSKNLAAWPYFQRVEDNSFHHSFCSENERRYLETVSFGAKEATIFSKRGSPRSGSHIGLRRNPP